MNIEILPPDGQLKYFGQIITFKDAFQVEFDIRIKCGWATFTSHKQELTSPIQHYPLQAPIQTHFVPSGTRSEQEYLEEFLLQGVNFLSPKWDGAQARALWPSGQVGASCTEN